MMTLNKLIDDAFVAAKNQENARVAKNRAKIDYQITRKQRELVELHLIAFVENSFKQYLDDHPEIPKEQYTVHFSNLNLLPNLAPHKIPSAKNYVVNIIMEDTNMKDKVQNDEDYMLYMEIHDVGVKFSEFINSNNSITVQVLRYFTKIFKRDTEDSLTTFYGRSVSYDKGHLTP